MESNIYIVIEVVNGERNIMLPTLDKKKALNFKLPEEDIKWSSIVIEVWNNGELIEEID